MPDIVIKHTARPNACRDAAHALIQLMPAMIVTAFQESGANPNLGDREMVIDIQPFNAHAYNAPSIGVYVNCGEKNAIYGDQLIKQLYRRVNQWRLDNQGLFPGLKDIDVQFSFGRSCGVSFNAGTGEVSSTWGVSADVFA